MRFLILALSLSLLSEPSPRFSLHVDLVKGRAISARAYTAPRMEFSILAGEPQANDILYCAQTVEARGTPAYDVLVIKCEDGTKLELRAVYFGE